MPLLRGTPEHPNARSLPLAHRRISDDSVRRHSWCTGSLTDNQPWYYTSSASTRSSSTGSSPRRFLRRLRARRNRLDCHKSAQRSPEKEASTSFYRTSIDKSDFTLNTEDYSEEYNLRPLKFDSLDSPWTEADAKREDGYHAPQANRGLENIRRSPLKTALSKSVPCCERDKKQTEAFIDLPKACKTGKRVTIRLVNSEERLSPPSPAPKSPEPEERYTRSLNSLTCKSSNIVCRKFLVKETHIIQSPAFDRDGQHLRNVPYRDGPPLRKDHREYCPPSSDYQHIYGPSSGEDYIIYEPHSSDECRVSGPPLSDDRRRCRPPSREELYRYGPPSREDLYRYGPPSREDPYFYGPPSSEYPSRYKPPSKNDRRTFGPYLCDEPYVYGQSPYKEPQRYGPPPREEHHISGPPSGDNPNNSGPQQQPPSNKEPLIKDPPSKIEPPKTGPPPSKILPNKTGPHSKPPPNKTGLPSKPPPNKTGPPSKNPPNKTGPPSKKPPNKTGLPLNNPPNKTGPPSKNPPSKTGPTSKNAPNKTPASKCEPLKTGPPPNNESLRTGAPLSDRPRRNSDLDNFKADNKLYSPRSPDLDSHPRGKDRGYERANSLLSIKEYEKRQFSDSQRPPMRRMNPLEDHERKIIIEFCHLLEKSKQLFNGLRELPQYGHKQWHSYFGRTFDVYTKLWKFQQQHRAILDCKYGLKRWQIGEIASKIGQLYYHFYLRTSETAYLNEAFSFYSAIRGRCYYTKASKEDKCELMVKKLRYYARFIVVCLLLKKIKLVRELIKELDRQIIEYGNTYDPDDQMEWIVVVDEVKAFIQSEPVITVLHPDNYPIVISYRLNPLNTPPVERSSQMVLSLQEVVIVGSSNQVKFSELTMDMYRMLHSLEREPSENAQHLYDDSPRPRFVSTPNAPTSKGYNLENGRRRDNPHKYLLFKPSPAQVLVYLSSGCHDLPPSGALLLYISADGHMPPQNKQTEEACYEGGGLITTSKNDIYRDNRSQDSKAGPSPSKYKEPQCLYPGDLLPYTRRPLFVIIDSDNSYIFQNLPRHFGLPLVVLMSPVELPERLQDQKQQGNLFTLFLHSPVSAFCYITDIINLSLSHWEKAMGIIDSFLVEASTILTRTRVDPAFIAFMGDDFLRLLLLRFIFCEVTIRRHRSFRNRNHHTRSSPSLPEELLENTTLTQIVMDLAGHLQVRSHFHDPSAGPQNGKE